MSTTLYVGIIEFIVLLLSLSVHESAHAWTADMLRSEEHTSELQSQR